MLPFIASDQRQPETTAGLVVAIVSGRWTLFAPLLQESQRREAWRGGCCFANKLIINQWRSVLEGTSEAIKKSCAQIYDGHTIIDVGHLPSSIVKSSDTGSCSARANGQRQMIVILYDLLE